MILISQIFHPILKSISHFTVKEICGIRSQLSGLTCKHVTKLQRRLEHKLKFLREILNLQLADYSSVHTTPEELENRHEQRFHSGNASNIFRPQHAG